MGKNSKEVPLSLCPIDEFTRRSDSKISSLCPIDAQGEEI
jgi:hypothetical protein